VQSADERCRRRSDGQQREQSPRTSVAI
jgi:hypothetical protein